MVFFDLAEPPGGECIPGQSCIICNTYGIRTQKKRAGPDPIGTEFEKAPAPFNVPVLFVVQLMGGNKFVVVSKV